MRYIAILFFLLFSLISSGQSWVRYESDYMPIALSDNQGGLYVYKGVYSYDHDRFIYDLWHYDRFGNSSKVDFEIGESEVFVNKYGKLVRIPSGLSRVGESKFCRILGRTVELYDENVQVTDTLTFAFNINGIGETPEGYWIVGSLNNEKVLALTDKEGLILKEKSFAQSAFYYYYGSQSPYALSDGGLIINDDSKRKMFRLDSNLEIVWEKGKGYVRQDNLFIWTAEDKLSQYDLNGNFVRDYKWEYAYRDIENIDYIPEEHTLIAVCTTAYNFPVTSHCVIRLQADMPIGYGTISGKVFDDVNENCLQDEGEAGIAGVLLKKSPLTQYALTDADGNYSFRVDSGVSYSIQPVSGLSRWQSLDCYKERSAGINRVKPDSSGLDFAVRTIKCPELRVRAGYSTYNRCFPGYHSFTIANTGTAPAHDVTATVEFPNDIIIKSVSHPYIIDERKYAINLSTLRSGEEMEIVFQDSIDCRAFTGYVAGKVSVVSSSACNEKGDVDVRAGFGGFIRGSYDPNDKSVFPSRINYDDYLSGERLGNFHINFQNTGDGPAYKVVVVDTLPAGTDVEGISNMSASHPYSVQVIQTDPVVIVWSFVNINLPGQEENEPESHGYVSFTLPVEEGLPDYTILENRAAIYFDYNAPIITNTATITISSEVETDSGIITDVKEVNTMGSAFKIYPNPVSEKLYIELSDAVQLPATMKLINTAGQEVRQYSINFANVVIDKLDLPFGLYHYILITNSASHQGNLLVR